MKNKNLLTTLLMLISMGFSLQGWGQCTVVIEPTATDICPEESVLLYAETLPNVLSTFAAGNGQDGNMFDIVALRDITITSFDGHPQNNCNIEIYYKAGTHVGYENSSASWTLLGSAYVYTNGGGVPTPIPIPVNVTIPAGEIYAFYITTTDDYNFSYTNGTAVGNVYAENSDLQLLEGKGNAYPFSTTFAPRIWNGQVHYTLSPTTYLWNTGETTPIITVNPMVTTLYSVEADMAGCVTFDSLMINVDDSAPVPDIASLPDINDDCTTLTPPTATDNCEGSITATTSDPITYTEEGTYVVTWEYNDGYGHITTQTQNVIIGPDVTPPVPDLATLPDIVGQCVVSVPTPTAWDNCDGTIYATTPDPTVYDVIGTYMITWTYTDGTGHEVVQTQNVEVNSGPDVTAPVPDLDPLPDVTGECSVAVTTIPTATDGCEGPVVGTTADPLSYNDQGTYTITWSYDDGLGNISTQEQTVIVEDLTAPEPDVAELPDIYDQCSVTVTAAPTATDNCEGTIVGTTTDPLIYMVQGVYTITWTYDDGNGNVSTQDQTVTVSDVFDPVPDVAELPALTGECSVDVTDMPFAWDNCRGQVYGSMSDPWTYTEQGSYIITWTYDDGNGNSVTQEQEVIVDDITAPVPDVADLPVISAECSASLSAPTATDNCEGAITGTTTDPTSYEEEGTYTVTWSYDDGNGNISTQDQTVVIDDITDPVPDLATLLDLVGTCSYTVTTIPTATDNCEGAVTATTEDTLYYDFAGVYTITWTYDDGNGNTVDQQQTISIEDNDAPVPDIADLPDIASECSVTLIPPTATDNCVGEVTGTTDTLFLDQQGSFTITWSYDDGNGNMATQDQLVVIDDTVSPTAICPEDVVACNEFTGSIALTAVSDNCGDPVVNYELSGATTATGSGDAGTETFNEGETLVTYTVDDGNGNTIQCNFTVTMELMADITVTLTDGTLSVATVGTYQWINCDGNTEIEGATESSFTPEETGEYAVTVTDGICTETSECVYVEVVDFLKNNTGTDIQIYPNPVEDLLILDLGVVNTNITLAIVNIGGQVVYQEEYEIMDKIEIDAHTLHEGIYLLNLSSDQQSGIVRFIKE
jgi:hypothetical protein